MSLNLTAVDYIALPTALLPQLKSHVRVDFADDDSYLTECARRAITQVERAGLSVFAATWEWTFTDSDDPANTPVPVPRQPVRSFAASLDGVDVTADCEIIGQQTIPQGPMPMYFSGDADLVTLTVGFTSAAELYPGLTDVILRLAAQLYQWREITVPNQAENFAPDWPSSALTLWVPSV